MRPWPPSRRAWWAPGRARCRWQPTGPAMSRWPRMWRAASRSIGPTNEPSWRPPMLKTVWAGLRIVLGVVTEGKLPDWDTTEQEAAVYGMWTAAARECGIENLVGKR